MTINEGYVVKKLKDHTSQLADIAAWEPLVEKSAEIDNGYAVLPLGAWESGAFDQSIDYASPNYIRMPSKVAVVPGSTIHLKIAQGYQARLFIFGSTQNFLSATVYTSDTDITLASNVYYVRMWAAYSPASAIEASKGSNIVIYAPDTNLVTSFDATGMDFEYSDKYVNGITGIITSDTGSVCTGFEPFDYGGMSLVVTPGYASAAAGYALYDKDFVRIAGGVYTSNPITIAVPYGTKYARFSCTATNLYKFRIAFVNPTIQDGIRLAKNEGDLDLTYRMPAILFSPENYTDTYWSREYIPSIVPDAIVDSKVYGLSFCGKRSLYVKTLRSPDSYDMDGVTTKDFTVPYGITADGYKPESGNVILRKSKINNAAAAMVKYLVIGDSINHQRFKTLDGEYVGGWNYSSIAKEIFMKDMIDLSVTPTNFVGVGTTGNYNQEFTYKENPYTIRAFHESRGTWMACTYLRHAMLCLTDGSATTTTRLSAAAAWDSLGLGTLGGTQTYAAYTGTPAQIDLIMSTVHGKYAHEYTATLWAALKVVFPTLVSWGGAYSSAENGNIDICMAELLSHPQNPFYDSTTAAAHKDDAVSYAFSITAYLGRYKTLADDGVTPLEVGVSAGSEVTDVTDYDVCTPSHITIALGTNDQYTARSTADTVLDIQKIAAICAADTTAQVGIFLTRQFGSWYPERWVDIGLTKAPLSQVKKYAIDKALQDAYPQAAMSKTDDIFYLPCWFVQGVLDASKTQYQLDPATGKYLIVPCAESSHPGILSATAFACQILGWIYYTLS